MHNEPIAENGHPPTVVAPSTMSERGIFRAQAMEAYLREQERAVMPRLVSPRVFGLLWVVTGLLLAVGFGILTWPVIMPLLAGGP